MVDYSRFDAIELSSEDEADARAHRGAPFVRRLDGAHRVTFGGGADAVATRLRDDDEDGAYDDDDVDASPEVVDVSEREYARMLERERAAAAAAAAAAATATSTATAAANEARPVVRERSNAMARLTRNGGRVDGASDGRGAYFWCQDARETTLSVVARPGARARDVRVRVTSTDVEISVAGTSGFDGSEVVFAERWAHEIDPEPRDEADEDGAREAPTYGDWEITDFEGTGPDARRVVRVTVRKKGSEMLTHWWRSCVKGGPEVDPATFEDRNASKASEAKRAWDEAQRMFRERVKNRQPVEVDIHSNDDSDAS